MLWPAVCRYCCKSPKLPGDNFPAVSRSDRRPPICVPSIALRRSLVSFSSGDEVPHILTRKSRLQPGEFLAISTATEGFLAAGDRRTFCTLWWRAAEKRQGRKSRRRVIRRQCRGLWGFSRGVRAKNGYVTGRQRSVCCKCSEWLHPNVSPRHQILFPCTAGAVHTWHEVWVPPCPL
jgi:hypothetical protein